MHILSKRTLREFWSKRPGAASQLRAWHAEVQQAQWEKPTGVKQRFPSASILGNDRIVFNICRNQYRLIVRINYRSKTVFVRFVGTHKEYDAIDAEVI